MMRNEAEHSSEQLLDGVKSDPLFELTQDDKQQILPKSRQNVLQNRVSWALVHLGMGKAITLTRKSVYQIAKRRKDILNDDPRELTIRFLHPPGAYFNDNRTLMPNRPKRPG